MLAFNPSSAERPHSLYCQAGSSSSSPNPQSTFRKPTPWIQPSRLRLHILESSQRWFPGSNLPTHAAFEIQLGRSMRVRQNGCAVLDRGDLATHRKTVERQS
nr:hypothetical protein CFP56_66816 [Quercus suber]